MALVSLSLSYAHPQSLDHANVHDLCFANQKNSLALDSSVAEDCDIDAEKGNYIDGQIVRNDNCAVAEEESTTSASYEREDVSLRSQRKQLRRKNSNKLERERKSESVDVPDSGSEVENGLDNINEEVEERSESTVEKMTSRTDLLASRRRFKLHLQIHASKKYGILTNAHLKSVRVTVLHVSTKGDALVNDGKNILMVPAECVAIGDDDEVIEGRRRLQFVKRIYDAVMRGDIIDTAAIYLEIQKWLL